MATHNTLEKLCDRFYWPSMEAGDRNFCQHCHQCQLTRPHKPAPAPLVPLLINRVPFERVGMALVDLLPKSARGHEYLLMMLDYATCCPEAVPLWKATSKNFARELVLLCSQVGLPKDLLTDQGTPFTSMLMSDMCRCCK